MIAPAVQDPLVRRVGSASFRVIARLWWIAARRLWRKNTILPFVFAALALIVVVDLTLIPTVNGGAYLSVLTVTALTIALLAPSQLRAGSVFESQRFELLPFQPFVVLLLRAVFGNIFRILLTIFVLLGCGIGITHLSLPPEQTGLELLKLLGCGLAGLLVIEIIEGILRRTSSILLHAAVLTLLVASLAVLAALRRIRPLISAGTFPTMHGPMSSVFIGGDAGLRWELAAAAAPFVLFLALLRVGKMIGEL